MNEYTAENMNTGINFNQIDQVNFLFNEIQILRDFEKKTLDDRNLPKALPKFRTTAKSGKIWNRTIDKDKKFFEEAQRRLSDQAQIRINTTNTGHNFEESKREEPPKIEENKFFLFRNSQTSRPSRSIMREAFPSLSSNGKISRQIPGMKADDKLY